MSTLLDTLHFPHDLRALSPELLPRVAQELRAFILASVAKTGGHLSSNLGTVELTLALHYVFNTPEDRLVWDVGHQTYAHKILTGRASKMATLRKQNGLSGFPKRKESDYDAFGVGHSSTSVSAALGMAEAFALKNEAHRAVAIIGDGAFSGGQAFEALNHAGGAKADLLVVLNDNDMSISKPVGAFQQYLAQILSGAPLHAAKRMGEKVLSVAPPLRHLASRVEEHMKGLFAPGMLFEELGFDYIGPIDGHDIPALLATLQNLKKLKGPRLLHVITKKGQGYLPAEADPILYHGVSSFEPTCGIVPSEKPAKPTYTQVFGQWLCDMAKADARLIGITPAMCEGSGMQDFAKAFPKRFFDVAIAEQHAVTFAAGLACEGLKPVLAIYSTFLQRGYDQLIHDVALQNLPVVFALDRAGLVGADGPTHHGSFDLSYLTPIPNLVIMCPADEDECRKMLSTAYHLDAPSVVRYPRGSGIGKAIENNLDTLPVGKAQVLKNGKNVAILAFGSLVPAALAAGEQIEATVVNMRFVKPMDRELILELAATHALFVTVEENAAIGGAGAEVARILEEVNSPPRLIRLGLPDQFMEHGEHKTLLSEVGLDEADILKAIARYKHS